MIGMEPITGKDGLRSYEFTPTFLGSGFFKYAIVLYDFTLEQLKSDEKWWSDIIRLYDANQLHLYEEKTEQYTDMMFFTSMKENAEFLKERLGTKYNLRGEVIKG